MQTCIRCDGELERGYILDRDGSNVTRQARWSVGEPDASFRTALWQRSAVQSIPETLAVITYRCRSCGRLESYAHAAAPQASRQP